MKSKIILILFFLLFTCSFVDAGVLQSGFAELRLTQKLDGTCIKYAPDGRVFVAQKPGIINILQHDTPTLTPTVCINFKEKVDNYNERGVQSLVLDPDFSTNGFLYVYYAVKDANHNRVSRFKVTGDVCDPASETTIIELDTLVGTIHNGGAMFFKGGKLFITTGDGFYHNMAQSLESLLGKVLRINKDGSIPSDNPFYWQTHDKYRSIYALGLRNPQSAAINPNTGRVLIGDVGDATWEEINELSAGANFGWPIIEGKRVTQVPPFNYVEPVYVYKHTLNRDMCAVVGAAWYYPTTPFPSAHRGKYYWADYCNNTIFELAPDTWTVTQFATGMVGAVSLDVAANGDFFYLARGGIVDINTRSYKGEVYRVRYTGSNLPTFSFEPIDITTTIGRDAVFSCGTSGNPLVYQWYVDGSPIANTNSSVYTFASPALTDTGKKIKVTVSDGGSNTITSSEATLTVISNTPPVPVIDFPQVGYKYDAGTLIYFAGTAHDNEDGDLYEANFVWSIVFHHDDHTHPGLDLEYEMFGYYFLPSVFETSSNVWYRFYLTVTDNSGTETTVYRDMYPNKATVTLDTNPSGLLLRLDGVEITTPHTFVGVVGIMRLVEAFTQSLNGTELEYKSWNTGDFGSVYNMSTPNSDSTILAYFGPPDNSLSGGAIAGIVVGCVVFVGFIVGGYFYYKKKILKRKTSDGKKKENVTSPSEAAPLPETTQIPVNPASPEELPNLANQQPTEELNYAPQAEFNLAAQVEHAPTTNQAEEAQS